VFATCVQQHERSATDKPATRSSAGYVPTMPSKSERLRRRVYSGLGFFVVFSPVFLVPVSNTFTLSSVGVFDSGFCSP
jgi:hypothetical protein